MSSKRNVRSIDDLERYRVGGSVRDKRLNRPSQDSDWVVVGASPEIMTRLGFKPIGKDFPVYLHPTNHEQYALARKERKAGRGYKGFEIDAGADITLHDDLLRRDLTMNAMAETPDGELIDPYGGMRDIEDRVLRHVSEHFGEDPLRVLRVARFAARYHQDGFRIHESTLALMRRMTAGGELKDLVAERVWKEIQASLECSEPWIFFETLSACGALQELIPEFDALFADGESRPATQSLKRACELTDKLEIRFATLAYHSGSQHGDQADAIIRGLCNRLKTPSQCLSISLLLSKHVERMRTLDELGAADVARMIGQIGGLRNEGHLLDFVLGSRAVDETSGDAGDQLIACLRAMRKVDGKSLSERYQGEELRQQIYDARVERVTEVLGRK